MVGNGGGREVERVLQVATLGRSRAGRGRAAPAAQEGLEPYGVRLQGGAQVAGTLALFALCGSAPVGDGGLGEAEEGAGDAPASLLGLVGQLIPPLGLAQLGVSIGASRGGRTETSPGATPGGGAGTGGRSRETGLPRPRRSGNAAVGVYPGLVGDGAEGGELGLLVDGAGGGGRGRGGRDELVVVSSPRGNLVEAGLGLVSSRA